MQAIRDAILSGDRSPETYSALEIPAKYRAVTVHKAEVDMGSKIEVHTVL